MNKKELLLKQAHIEVIPEGWELLTLKDILKDDPQNGYSPNCPEVPNGKWILGLGNLTESGFDPRDAKPAPLDDPKVDQFKLQSGDFIISRSNTPDKVGRTALFKGEIENCSYPDLMMRFRVNEKVSDIGFIEKVLSATKTQQYYKSHSAGSSNTMVKINKSVVKKTPILLPPLPEQKAIADLLTTWDEAIEKTEGLVKAKVKRFKALLRQLINEPSADVADSRRWKNLKLGDLFGTEIIVEKGRALTKNGISAGDVPVVAGGQTYAYYTNTPTHKMPSITISASGAYAGFVWYHNYPICASDCNVLYSRNASTLFLYYALKSLQHRIYALQSGGAQPHVYSKDLKNLHVIYPPLKEQQRIAETLSTAQQEIDLLKQLANKYKNQKRGLMQKMLTGTWRVEAEILNKYKEA